MKDTLAELKVNQDELRQDRDEWRWRAERLLADQQRGAWWRWRRRAAAALDAVTASFCGLLADVQNKLAEMKANGGELRQQSRAVRLSYDGGQRRGSPYRGSLPEQPDNKAPRISYRIMVKRPLPMTLPIYRQDRASAAIRRPILTR